MTILPILALLLGFGVVYLLLPAIPPGPAYYVGLAILAGFDAIVGGLRARLEGQFDEAIFVSGFFVNMIVAGGLAYLFADRLNIQEFYLAVAVALGIRIFNNLGRIRGLLVTHRVAARAVVRPQAPPEL